MRLAHRRGATPQTPRERGAVIVEMAFIVTLLLLMVAGTFDYGFAWKAGLAANESVRTATRVGSGQATSPGADYYALNGMRSALTASGQVNRVQKVVIFKSTTTDGKVPTSCLAASPTGTCNVLTGSQFRALTLSSFDLTIGSNSVATGTGCLKTTAATRVAWCPNVRSNNQDSGADYYGAYVELTYTHQFPFLGRTTKVTRTSVMRLEPSGFGS